MSTMKFNTATIAELASRLGALTEQLKSSGALPTLTAEQFGSPVLVHRMQEFTQDWSDGMDRIVGELEHTAALLRDAAEHYGKTEFTVQAAVKPKS